MKSLQDAVYNWLTIEIVAKARPEDKSAQETADLFQAVLKEEFQADSIKYRKEGSMYTFSCMRGDEPYTVSFPSEMIEMLANQISAEPSRYKNYE
ncbi:hypothetical protein LRR81_06825 [Metabacillus sp. GX 13764]|uniref:hypothetical protein n=1 Tax=Metabacillus kandeliae TaxID=2900151 RepID=UPI001E4DEF09|nr:hypothetical protein [Metabacillus kandeliae]MCD7033945.1 hypothetical protein [Metabacillus kandeliae]